MSSAASSDELTGEIAAVIFANEANGFAVVELAGDGDADGARASGPLAELALGQPVRLLGRWTHHPKHGPTFTADSYEQAEPQTTEGLVAFLSSRRFPGVGGVKARQLVQAFGLELDEAIAEGPHAIARVKGISMPLAQTIVEAWTAAGALAELVQRLSAVGVPVAAAHAIHQRFGDRAEALIEADPYALLAARGVTWTHVEALARAAGIDARDRGRLAAGAAVAHRQECARGGHVALDTDTLVTATSRLLRLPPDDAHRAVEVAAERRVLVSDAGHGGDAWWYTPADRAVEVGLAEELVRLRLARSRVASACADASIPPGLTAEQEQAVHATLRHPVTVLTGGPGTGKTRTVTEIVGVADEAGLQVALCAPTGRAAKRLEEVTGHSATTVHRLLGARPAGADEDGEAGFAFGYDADRRLPQDLIIADEWSMADQRLAWALTQAVDDGAHLLLVGDADQLPSVGPGAVLRDLLDPRLSAQEQEPEVVVVNRLQTIHRQAASSRIVTLAHEINAGEVPLLSGRQGDVFVVPERSDGIAARVAEIVAVRAPDFYGLTPADVQVLAPMYRGPAGVDSLNAALKERLNPAAGRPAVGGFHEGDRVVQTRNDAELDVANGDIGEVVAADAKERTLEVAFPQGGVTYPAERLGDLRPAWCLTVHKSQGGEWPVVILVLDRSHRAMLWRELTYTAVTRATRGLLLVGDAGLLTAAARRTGSGVRLRRTALVRRVREHQRLRECGLPPMNTGRGAAQEVR